MTQFLQQKQCSVKKKYSLLKMKKTPYLLPNRDNNKKKMFCVLKLRTVRLLFVKVFWDNIGMALLFFFINYSDGLKRIHDPFWYSIILCYYVAMFILFAVDALLTLDSVLRVILYFPDMPRKSIIGEPRWMVKFIIIVICQLDACSSLILVNPEKISQQWPDALQDLLVYLLPATVGLCWYGMTYITVRKIKRYIIISKLKALDFAYTKTRSNVPRSSDADKTLPICTCDAKTQEDTSTEKADENVLSISAEIEKQTVNETGESTTKKKTVTVIMLKPPLRNITDVDKKFLPKNFSTSTKPFNETKKFGLSEQHPLKNVDIFQTGNETKIEIQDEKDSAVSLLAILISMYTSWLGYPTQTSYYS